MTYADDAVGGGAPPAPRGLRRRTGRADPTSSCVERARSSPRSPPWIRPRPPSCERRRRSRRRPRARSRAAPRPSVARGDEGSRRRSTIARPTPTPRSVMDWALLELGGLDRGDPSPGRSRSYESIGDLSAAAPCTTGSARSPTSRAAGGGHRARTSASSRRRSAGETRRTQRAGCCNVAEVLSDQGRWEEAEERLRVVLRVARGAKEQTLTAYATAYLGRVASRATTGGTARRCSRRPSSRSWPSMPTARPSRSTRGRRSVPAFDGKWERGVGLGR